MGAAKGRGAAAAVEAGSEVGALSAADAAVYNKSLQKLGNKPWYVSLYGLEHEGIVVEWSTGACYHQQTGGLMCNQQEAEGFLIPISLDWRRESVTLAGLYQFAGSDSLPGAFQSDPTAEFDAIDKLLRLAYSAEGWRVDRERAKQGPCEEAWVPVVFDRATMRIPQVLESATSKELPDGTKGWLTWPNSD